MSGQHNSQLKQLSNVYEEAQRLSSNETKDAIVTNLYSLSYDIANNVTKRERKSLSKRYEKLDDILTSPVYGFPIMLVMLGMIFYITIAGANVPSQMLADLFSYLEGQLLTLFQLIHAPEWLSGLLILGLFKGVGAVVSVMLPPMAIFFPIFSLLENFGYLPRVAFNLDRIFKKTGAHGKQSLTMAMGFGCNAAAIMSTRIIESPRERMLAILTNNFVPCNGRWPTLILLATLFMAGAYTSGIQTLVVTATLVGFVLLGVVVTFIVSYFLSKTLLKGMPTHYTLELPPYRKPLIFDTIIRSSLTKSLSVLMRAVKVAIPASILIWLLANIHVGDASLLVHGVNFIDPFAKLMGLDGYILMAFILGLPANEIVFPILIMGYLATGSMTDFDSLTQLKTLLLDNGWTMLTALNMMLFSLLHYPCGTTLVNIYKETKSKKWTFLSFLIPTVIAVGTTMLTTLIYNMFLK
ncbi:MAG: nucleoside recognition domain-containing protein [Bacillaceae bacterium]